MYSFLRNHTEGKSLELHIGTNVRLTQTSIAPNSRRFLMGIVERIEMNGKCVNRQQLVIKA